MYPSFAKSTPSEDNLHKPHANTSGIFSLTSAQQQSFSYSLVAFFLFNFFYKKTWKIKFFLWIISLATGKQESELTIKICFFVICWSSFIILHQYEVLVGGIVIYNKRKKKEMCNCLVITEYLMSWDIVFEDQKYVDMWINICSTLDFKL